MLVGVPVPGSVFRLLVCRRVLGLVILLHLNHWLVAPFVWSQYRLTIALFLGSVGVVLILGTVVRLLVLCLFFPL